MPTPTAKQPEQPLSSTHPNSQEVLVYIDLECASLGWFGNSFRCHSEYACLLYHDLTFLSLHWGFRCEGFSPGQWPRALPMGPGWHCSSGLLRVGAHWELKSVSPLKAEDASCVLLPQSLLPPCLCLPAWPSVLLSLLDGTPQATLVSCRFLLCP